MTARPDVRFLDRTTPPHIVTLVLIAGIAAMNMSVFLPSLPAMTEAFDTNYAVMQLSVTLYLAVTALLQFVIGPISDRYGRRVLMLWCVAIFVVSSIGCMLAQDVTTFLVFRMLQGFVSVGIALSRAVVRDMVPQSEAASMIGYVTMGMALVPMFAPMIGGGLDLLFGWRATFAFLVIFGSVVFWICWRDLGETSKGHFSSFAEQFRDYPELLGSRRFWGYVFAAAFASGAFFAFLGGSPYVASKVFGLNAFWAGFYFGAPAIGYALGNFLTGRFTMRVGLNKMILLGTIITAGGMIISLLLTLAGFISPWLFFGFCTTVGLGNGLVMPNATAGMLSVRPHLAGTASGLGGAILISGGAALSAFAGFALEFGGGTIPLQIVMVVTSAFAVISILFVIRRENRLTLADKSLQN